MYWQNLSLLFAVDSSRENVRKIYILLFLLATRYKYFCIYILITSFFIPLNCVRITIDFTDRSCTEKIGFSSDHSCFPMNSKSESGIYHAASEEIEVYERNQFCINKTPTYVRKNEASEDNYTCNKRFKVSENVETISNIKITSMYYDLSNNLFQKSDTHQWCEDNIENSVNKNSFLFQNPSPILIFEYSSSYMIRSKYFDGLKFSEFTEIHLNIKDITKSNIDIIMCKECLNILCYGLNYCILGLNNENFLDFIWFFHDLSCYSESDALDIFYKNLLPFLFSYIADKSSLNVFNMQDSDFLKFRNIFWPFLIAYYDTIDIYFDLNTKELMFIEKKGIRKFNLFGLDSTEEIVIRTTPKALSLMHIHHIHNRQYFLWRLISSFRIYGIRISENDKYYSEYKDSEISWDSSIYSLEVYGMQSSFCSVFTIVEQKGNEIKLIEFEKFHLTDTDVSFLYSNENIESLIVVRCNMEKLANFLRTTVKSFFKLRILQIIGFNLKNWFFDTLYAMNIEILDLSCCRCIESSNKCTNRKMGRLKEFRMNYSDLNHDIIESIMECGSLDVLYIQKINFSKFKGFKNSVNWQKSYRILDISGCIFINSLLEFFSTDIKCEILILEYFCNLFDLIKILDQKSLHSSTKNLSLSKNSISYKVFKVLDKFENLEFLNISNLDKESIYFKISDVDFPTLYLDIDSDRMLDEKKTKTILELPPSYRKERNPSNFDFKTGFLECLCATGLSTSLRGINLSKNELDSANILRIEWLVNLNYLIVSFNDKIFSGFLKEYGALKFSNLETLILVSTNINNDIYHFVMTLPLLRNFETRECKFVEDILVSNLNLYPMVLEKIVFTNTIYSSYFKSVLEEMRAKRINVIVN
ncbi:hypothetical protein CWI36_1325p0020 [Hamiltosporidium magnivora]|uniref:Leucine-rich repeat-containing protein n=1 Tax=Hamiltosporidium magnivora TaxID=148818 RepID=A0A4Q9L293_9MICR|nr:hypothetical protein CWI36_1325p0020 [Hamiltosporidium magnivora]